MINRTWRQWKYPTVQSPDVSMRCDDPDCQHTATAHALIGSGTCDGDGAACACVRFRFPPRP